MRRWPGRRAAREANSLVLLAHAMGEQAYALHDLGRLTDALSLVRAGAGLRCDLAQAFLTRGELDEARQHLRGARLLANQVGSVRQRGRVMSIGLAA
jgi:hypothetical protein